MHEMSTVEKLGKNIAIRIFTEMHDTNDLVFLLNTAECHAVLGQSFPSASKLAQSIQAELDVALNAGTLTQEDRFAAVIATVMELEELSDWMSTAEESAFGKPYVARDDPHGLREVSIRGAEELLLCDWTPTRDGRFGGAHMTPKRRAA